MPRIEADFDRPLRDAVKVQILDSFYVTSRYVSRVEHDLIRQHATPENMRNLGVLAQPDQDAFTDAEADAYVLGWEGCTRDILEAIGGPLKFHFEWNGDGSLPYDRELARDLWRVLPRGFFALKIQEKAQSVYRELYEQKKRQPRPSADTSGATG